MSEASNELPVTRKSRAFGVSAIAARKVEKQGKVKRWNGYEGRKQSVAQHIASAVAVTAPVVMEMLKLGGVRFDEVLLLKAIGIHDVGEVHHIDDGNDTDVLYQDKSADCDLREYEKFCEIYEDFKSSGSEEAIFSFPSDRRVFHSLHRAYLLQHGAKDISRFPADAQEVMKDLRDNNYNTILAFQLIERMGYIQYAYEQYICDNNLRILVQTLNAQGPHIDQLMKYFSDRFLSDTVHGVQIKQEVWGEKLRNELLAFTEEYGKDHPNPPMNGREVWFPDQTIP